MGRQLGDQAGLADAGLAPHQDDGRFPICGPHPGRLQEPQLLDTADEGRARARDHGLSRPRRWATAAASPRPATPSLARILETWTPAVLGAMNSSWPICRLVRPAATST